MKEEKFTQEQIDSLYWRYKKKTPPIDEFADKNGEVKTTKLPHPLKCSKCDYIATSRADLNLHWLDDH